MKRLSSHFQIRRRYMRSVNLERDTELADSLEGYVLTPRAVDTFDRVLQAFSTPNVTRAWTLTGVYGTGKSAFANFLAALFAPSSSQIRRNAERLLQEQATARELLERVRTGVPAEGLVRALVTARREPLSHTLIRGLGRGAEEFWSLRRGRKPEAVRRILELRRQLLAGEHVSSVELPELTQEIAQASGTGLVLIIDELGKLLEHAGRTSGAEDLFLLQQLAELPAGPDEAPVLVLGLLHQAFSEYGQLLSSAERAEWEKVQGRFEDVPFAESPDQLIRLMAEAIEANLPSPVNKQLRQDAELWHDELAAATTEDYLSELLPADRIRRLYPIHPVAALALPALCTRYGQHDRSLFTFLASNETHALGWFLEQTPLGDGQPPLLQLPTVYDYFIDSARVGATGRVQLHRWAEVHGAIREAAGMDADALAALKVIGTLNLVASSGTIRARRGLVLSALSNRPADASEKKRWQDVLDNLVERRVITYRQQVDEYRIWQGSDFDIDAAVEVRLEAERRPLSELLEEARPLAPIVAQRHSYVTGTLRFFERRFVDDHNRLEKLEPHLSGSAGVVIYWVGQDLPPHLPKQTADGKPLALISVEPTPALVAGVKELLALQQIQRKESALQTDGVARKEVAQRLDQAHEVLDDVLRIALSANGAARSWFGGWEEEPKGHNAALSDLCDKAYDRGPVLWNEIINRRELTSQGARAQREVISALLSSHREPRLGIEGSGPAFSIYSSLLENTGIHRREEGEWVIGPPEDQGVQDLWKAIDEFCLGSLEHPRPLSDLFDILEGPPYGATTGVIPIFLAAVLLYHADDVSLYQDGTFSPTLTAPQFELLVKDPTRFAVKYFELSGIRWQLFKDIEAVVKAGGAQRPSGARNATLLTVVKPLVQFANSLPAVTHNAKDLSDHARKVLDALRSGREPDQLIFAALPEAVGHKPFRPGNAEVPGRHEDFRHLLFIALRELQQHYDRVLERCKRQIHDAFGMRADPQRLREDLRVRASYMVGKVIDRRMRSLVLAAVDERRSDKQWLEALVMILADRPADNWTPENRLAFELNLGDFARRFKNLEALQRDGLQESMEGFEARRLTITEPTGEEVHRLLWIRRQDRDTVRIQADELLTHLDGIADEHQRQAILMAMLERVLGPGEEPEELDIGPEDARERKRNHG
jgi:hypothetical protein